MKNYYDFETRLLEDSKQNIIYKLWFAEKQLEALRKERKFLRAENENLKIEISGMKLIVKAFVNE